MRKSLLEWLNLSIKYDTSDVTEDDNGHEEEDIDWEISPPRKGEIRQAFEVLRSCCLFQDDGEQTRKNVLEIEKMHEVPLMKKKQQSHITDFFKL